LTINSHQIVNVLVDEYLRKLTSNIFWKISYHLWTIIWFKVTASNTFMQFVQKSSHDTSKQSLTKSPSVKGLNDLTIKWNISKHTSVTCSEELEHSFKNILLDFHCMNYRS